MIFLLVEDTRALGRIKNNEQACPTDVVQAGNKKLQREIAG